VLAGRYRIVSRLGKGGMGEVYRADDLKLGQPVALKFLPAALAGDALRLAHLHEEVRLARQLAHPHVCRVYDIGEADGQPFLSMEFIDGEDLASLLKRIGRLPPDKGVEIARQLCLGLAAAHDIGILHRDLKPANVMLDGRGRVRLTDFGLARLADRVDGADARSGTPAYMAPEQLAGKEATARSDLYALGLVLYEVFTGKKAFPAKSAAERARLQESSDPLSPSSHVSDLDPAVERVILRCLEKEPRHRPPSALAVAAALPGGDPLAAALAAGETPSPEMVAASGGEGSLHPAVAAACLAGFLVGLVLIVLLSGQTTLLGLAPLEQPPEVLVKDARDILRELGHDRPPGDSAFGFAFDRDYVRYIAKENPSPTRWDVLASGRPPAVFFWYRQSPGPLTPTRLFGRGLVTPDDPPPVVSGMAYVMLDPKGNLLECQVVPRQQVDPERHGGAPDWKPLFKFAGFQHDQFTADAKRGQWEPPFPTDPPVAWKGKGVFAAWPDVEVRVEAAAYQGKPVYFRVIGPWTRPERDQVGPGYSGELFGLELLLILVGAVLAVRNVRLGRGDRKGAFCLALVLFLTEFVSWMLSAGHVKALNEKDLVRTGAAAALLEAAILWLSYLAFEPFARRLWPHVLISWTRLLAGRFRDPVVGRDLLVGVLGGVAFSLLMHLTVLWPSWLGLPTAVAESPPLAFLGGGRYWAAWLLSFARHGIFYGLVLWLMLFLLLRVILRKSWLAAGVWVAVWTVGFCGVGPPSLSWIFCGLAATICLAISLRCGLIAAAVLCAVQGLLDFPISSDLSAWYARNGLYSIVAVSALAGYGFVTSLGGRPLFGQGWLGEE
jgi:serine/threonine-protein kinase